MGSFGEEPNDIDATVGGLVWVLRRNGSWWPGQIIGPDELSEGCMPTSRVGTPIKLLGRDDAVVEWHNLDKSKRVKAFRCGQFDYCIEKAKESSTTSHLSRKSIKYSRREDAILEALKLERALLGLLDQPDFSMKQAEPSLKQENEDGDDGSEDDSESVHEMSQPGVSFNEQDLVDTIKNKSKRSFTLNNSDDDGSEGVKRMRGIEDLGMGVASKTKGKGSLKVAKGHELFKRKNRSRPLTKVLEVSRSVVCKEPFESHDSKKNNSVVKNTSGSTTGVSCENATSLAASVHGSPYDVNRTSLFDVPIGITEKKNSAGSSKIILALSPTSQPRPASLSSQSSHIETMSLGTEEPNDSNSTSSRNATIPTISHTLSKATSNWRVKGKRNSRSRKTGVNDETETRARKSRSITEIHLAEFPGWSMNAHHKESSPTKRPAGDLSQRLLPYRHSRFTVNPKYESSDFPIRHHVNRSGLYDVNIEVKASRRPQGVPYISLMSKLNGRPVIGNPVEIEVLEDGFCDSLLNVPQSYNSSSESDYKDVKVHQKRGTHGKPPAMPGSLVTKRGTLRKNNYPKFRKSSLLDAPQSYNSSSESDYDDDKVHLKRGTHGKPPAMPSSLVTKRGTLRKHNYPKFRKSSKTGLLTGKTKTGLMAKKTRKLSSLSRSTANSEGEEEKKLITEKVNPVVACVPLKVVFSRLNADLSNSMRGPAPPCHQLAACEDWSKRDSSVEIIDMCTCVL